MRPSWHHRHLLRAYRAALSVADRRELAADLDEERPAALRAAVRPERAHEVAEVMPPLAHPVVAVVIGKELDGDLNQLGRVLVGQTVLHLLDQHDGRHPPAMGQARPRMAIGTLPENLQLRQEGEEVRPPDPDGLPPKVVLPEVWAAAASHLEHAALLRLAVEDRRANDSLQDLTKEGDLLPG